MFVVSELLVSSLCFEHLVSFLDMLESCLGMTFLVTKCFAFYKFLKKIRNLCYYRKLQGTLFSFVRLQQVKATLWTAHTGFGKIFFEFELE